MKKTYQISKESNSIFYIKGEHQFDEIIMHSGLTNFEEKSAEIISQNGGDILEIGFGMGISANFITSRNISTYTCVEINDYLFQDAQSWSNGKSDVTIIQDSWQNFFNTTTNKYDAIYCDSLDFGEYEEFYQKVKNVSKIGTVVSTYGSGAFFGTTNMNIFENIPPPSIFDNNFTQEIFERLVSRGYYKVYWQYFDGTNFVKTLG